jgi:hypothetical protein
VLDLHPGRARALERRHPVMIVLLVLILVCIALWYVMFVVFSAIPWRLGKKTPLATKGLPSADVAHSDHPVMLGWTALDDQQLTRLLKGSAP